MKERGSVQRKNENLGDSTTPRTLLEVGDSGLSVNIALSVLPWERPLHLQPNGRLNKSQPNMEKHIKRNAGKLPERVIKNDVFSGGVQHAREIVRFK